MNQDTIRFLKATYKEYYFRNSDSIEFPTHIEEREFGYMPFGGSMVRHLSFRSSGEVIAEIVREAPSSMYCSNARYSSPCLPMEEKEWKGAELIFDIDATDIPTDCKKSHDSWYCQGCNRSGRLPKPTRCPYCGAGDAAELHGVCQKCLGASREHLLRLLDLLTQDFGVARKDIRAYFSGNRGYHLHVYDERFHPLGSPARAEVVHYVRGADLELSTGQLVSLRRGLNNKNEWREEYGWFRRITKEFSAIESENDPTKKRGGLQRAVTRAIEGQVALVDPSVTTDIHRVFRMPGTLHGTTGMLKMHVNSLDDFDPLSDPVVLGEENVKVSVKYSPHFTLRGQKFGPFRLENVLIPVYAAVYLLARDLAEVS